MADRYEQNTNKGVITITEYNEKNAITKRRKTNHHTSGTYERKRKGERINCDEGESSIH
jgi:hypothetical protein